MPVFKIRGLLILEKKIFNGFDHKKVRNAKLFKVRNQTHRQPHLTVSLCMEQFMLMRLAHLWGDKLVSWGRPFPLNSQPHLIPLLEYLLVKVLSHITG